MSEEVVETSMQIILHAGNARTHCQKALNCLSEYDYEQAEQCMKEAHEEIVQAHRIQTDAIQDEVRGQKKDYSLLFAHAQDTLMTINSEILIADHLLKITTSLDKRIKTLETQPA